MSLRLATRSAGKMHLQNVGLCRENLKNKCKYKNECWYKHISATSVNNETLQMLTNIDQRIKEMEEEIRIKINE